MAKFPSRLQDLRMHHGLTQQQLAEKIGCAKSTVNMYEKGNREPSLERMEAIADIFNVDMGYLVGASNIPNSVSTKVFVMPVAPRHTRPVARKKYPMLGNVACGEPTFADEQHDIYVDAVDGVDADFCLTAKGNSMVNARIFDGDILFVKQQESVDDGEIAVVLIEDETTVKRVYYDKENNVLTLMPENPTHKPMRFEGAKLNQIRILGKVVSGQYIVK